MTRSGFRRLAAHGLALFLAGCAVQAAVPPGTRPVPLNVRRALRNITAYNLKGDLSFLASDTLEGRYTPSPGLNVAAEFIASQFRAAGLSGAGNDGYFQTVEMIDAKPGVAQSALQLRVGQRTWTIPTSAVAVLNENRALHLQNVAVIAFSAPDPEKLRNLNLAGKAVLVPSVNFRKLPHEQMMAAYTRMRAFEKDLAASQAAMEIVAAENLPQVRPTLSAADDSATPRLPRIAIASDEVKNALADPSVSTQQGTVSIALSGPEEHKVTLKNVVGVLPGSDPVLKNTYVLLTAHYDHIGTRETAVGMTNPSAVKNTGDQIYNGANDDGSGTVSVVEIARGLAGLNPHPKRSIVFMTFFGEERGEIGSHYYADHPLFPIAKTVADVNLEQVGRTDSTDGQQINTASLTGYDYSDVTSFLEQAGTQTGIHVYLNKDASDSYFLQSDNAALAEKGIPAHSLTVAFDYSDYHGLGDEWQKVDYDNMARVDQMVALGLVNIANSATPPRWNDKNPKTEAFREAQKKAGGL